MQMLYAWIFMSLHPRCRIQCLISGTAMFEKELLWLEPVQWSISVTDASIHIRPLPHLEVQVGEVLSACRADAADLITTLLRAAVLANLIKMCIHRLDDLNLFWIDQSGTRSARMIIFPQPGPGTPA